MVMINNINDYYIVRVYDNYDYETIGAILLNNKHKIEDFRKAIKKAKEKHYEDIQENGCDWEYIEQELNDFDYYKFDFNNDCIDY